MSSAEQPRCVAIMTELLSLTNHMLSKRNDSDIMVDGVEKRQALMDEFDALPKDAISEEDHLEIKRIAKDILQKDKILNTSLEQHHKEAKANLSQNNSQQRLLGYTNNAIAGSGSYMDYKK